MKPNPNNFCGGNFQDWLEVMLLPECNGKCSWCIERNGFRPENRVSTMDLFDAIAQTGKKNIILLGGEPTLYHELDYLVWLLVENNLNVYITTNGSNLTPDFVDYNLQGIYGINISIHHYDPKKNKKITGIDIPDLKGSIDRLKFQGATVRFNCNLIKGHIDSEKEILKYIDFAKEMGADSVRFAELKIDEENFVDSCKIMNGKFGLNDDPFVKGCQINTTINGMDINFRQMCGLQTSKRAMPESPEQCEKQVLYYDGKVYNGWLKKDEGEAMTKKQKIEKILNDVKCGEKTTDKAVEELAKMLKTKTVTKVVDNGYGCRY